MLGSSLGGSFQASRATGAVTKTNGIHKKPGGNWERTDRRRNRLPARFSTCSRQVFLASDSMILLPVTNTGLVWGLKPWGSTLERTKYGRVQGSPIINATKGKN